MTVNDATVLKKKAAKVALRYIKDGMVLGLGSGSTVKILIDMLRERISEGAEMYFVSSSYDTSIYAAEAGMKEVSPLEHYPELAIDGADIVLKDKVVVKGGGGAFLREKIIDYAAKSYIIIVDETKLRLSENSAEVPLEVLPPFHRYVYRELRKSSDVLYLELRMSEKKLGPVVSDNGNFILDAKIEATRKDWPQLELWLNSIPGVLENGIFALKKPAKIIVGKREGVDILE